ncbi:unnamed protein product [Rotaria socialis]|uniref:Integrase catalytic domain-containing protein n=2 Tax=Rotaria socialis TaxID=392032 RepID=A0A820TW63_9BILA|nr:unnamed protein product [Rotaria socialis]
MSWLRDTGVFIVKERYPETGYPFIIRHLLSDDALDYYPAHEDMIFNFYDLRKLLLHKQNVLAPVRTLPTLDSIATLSLTAAPPVLTSTQLPTSTTDKTIAMTTYTFAQSLEDLTQNDIRKTIIEGLQRNTAKFTGEHRQDVIKWLKTLEFKFDTADIPTAKKFYLIPQIAMQKLHSYTQSPHQDVPSFCSEMRKLFSEADPQMSSTMKLELLLAKVKPGYRLDLLKQKSKDPTEFEKMAQDIENIYLVNEAIEQNTEFNIPDRTSSYQSSNRQQRGSSVNSRNTTRQNLFNYHSSSLTQQSQLQPSLSTSSIPPLMPPLPSTSSSQSQLSQSPASAATLICQWCSQAGHSARGCSFKGWSRNPVGSQNFFNQIALLCRRYNEKKNQQTFNRTVTHSQLPQRLFNDSKRLYRPTPSIHHVTLNTLPHFSSSQFQQTRDLLVNHLLDRDNKDRLLALLAQFSQLFDNSRHNISNIVVENVFNTVPHSPPSFRPHRNRHHREETQRLIEEFLEAAMIQESNLPYAAPAFIVPRKDNRPSRLVVDYRALNKITIPDVSPLPHMEDLLQELGKGYKYFSRLDLKSGYHQFRIPTADRPKTAFVVSQGHYEFRVLSMGPQNAPAAFQKTMYAVMKSCREFCHVFLDDIIICSKSFDDHIAAPIHRISNLAKDRKHLFKWTVEHSNAFHALKHLLTTAPLFLHFSVEDFPLHLATDASGTATGGFLCQDVNGERHNLFYHSKVLSPTEQKYSVPEKEALTIYHCLQCMRTLILGRTVYIHTDHCPICGIVTISDRRDACVDGMLQKPVNNRRIERVANLIQEYRIAEMKHINGKSNCLADYLSRPSDYPLFDIDYGLESKLPYSTSSNLTNPCQPSKNIVAYMTLRPQQKNSCTRYSFTTCSPLITTTPSPNVFDSNQLSHEQAQDPTISRIISQLNHSSHPDSTLSSSFIIKNGILHKLITLSPKSKRRLCVPYLPSSMIQSLLTAIHDDPFQSGHFSIDKIMSKIRTRYWWPHMKQDVHSHVQACVLCQQYNYSRQKKSGHLQPIPPVAIPLSVTGMDFCGPFAESPRENKYVLVVTDLFTHFVTAIPLPTNTAGITALTLFRHIFCRFGVCSTLITDQGTHFNNNLMSALQHLLSYNHILGAPYHPQTNGVVEPFNASMVVQISKLQQKHHNNWNDYLDAVVFAYNSSKHKTTQYSPFELFFGRSPKLPIDSPPQYYQFDRPSNYFVHLQKILQVYHQQAKLNIMNQQRYHEKYYDYNRRDPHYNVGDRVFTKIFAARGKLDPRYSTEPKIIVQINHPTYTVRHEPTGLEHSYHVSDLRPVTLTYVDNDSI